MVELVADFNVAAPDGTHYGVEVTNAYLTHCQQPEDAANPIDAAWEVRGFQAGTSDGLGGSQLWHGCARVDVAWTGPASFTETVHLTSGSAGPLPTSPECPAASTRAKGIPAISLRVGKTIARGRAARARVSWLITGSDASQARLRLLRGGRPYGRIVTRAIPTKLARLKLGVFTHGRPLPAGHYQLLLQAGTSTKRISFTIR